MTTRKWTQLPAVDASRTYKLVGNVEPSAPPPTSGHLVTWNRPMNAIPWGTLQWPRWGRIPRFFEETPALECASGKICRPSRDASVERRTQIDGVAYLVRGNYELTEAYRYVDSRPGMRRAIQLFRCEANVFDVMEQFPSYLIRYALE